MKYIKALIIVWLIAFGLILAFYFLALIPESRTLKKYNDQLNRDSKKLEFLRKAKEMRLHQVMDEEITIMKKNCSEILFSESDLSLLDFRIHDIAQECIMYNFANRVISSKKTQDKTKPKAIEERSYLISFNCSFPDFVMFINKLEQHEGVMFVDQFTINMDTPTTGIMGELYINILYTKDEGSSEQELEQAPQETEPEVPADMENLSSISGVDEG